MIAGARSSWSWSKSRDNRAGHWRDARPAVRRYYRRTVTASRITPAGRPFGRGEDEQGGVGGGGGGRPLFARYPSPAAGRRRNRAPTVSRRTGGQATDGVSTGIRTIIIIIHAIRRACVRAPCTTGGGGGTVVATATGQDRGAPFIQPAAGARPHTHTHTRVVTFLHACRPPTSKRARAPTTRSENASVNADVITRNFCRH